MHLRGSRGLSKKMKLKNWIFRHICDGFKGYSAFTDFIKNQSIGAAWGVLDTLVWIFEYLTDWLFAGPLSVDF